MSGNSDYVQIMEPVCENKDDVQILDLEPLQILKPVHENSDDVQIMEPVDENSDDVQIMEPVDENSDDVQIMEPIDENTDDVQIMELVHENSDDVQIMEPVDENTDDEQIMEPVHENSDDVQIMESVDENTDDEQIMEHVHENSDDVQIMESGDENSDYVQIMEPVHPASRPSQDTAGGYEDATEYLKAVKATFEDEKHKFSEFLGILDEFKDKGTDGEAVIARIKELFKGHPELISGFEKFLQEGYGGSLGAHYNGLDFADKIKERLSDQDYHTFFDLLDMYTMKKKSLDEFQREVAVLLKDEADLFEEFKNHMEIEDAHLQLPQLRCKAANLQRR